MFSDLKLSKKEEVKYGAIIHLSLIFSEIVSFKSKIALWFSVEDTIIVFFLSGEVSSIVSVFGSYSFSISSRKIGFRGLSCNSNSSFWFYNEASASHFSKFFLLLIEYII